MKEKKKGERRESGLIPRTIGLVALGLTLLSLNVSTAEAGTQERVKRDHFAIDVAADESGNFMMRAAIQTKKRRCQSKRLVRIYFKKNGKKRLLNSVRTKRNGLSDSFWVSLPPGNAILSGIAPKRNDCKRLRYRSKFFGGFR